jgi:hypothetical protein
VPPISEELEQLLWLFAEDTLDEADEPRLWELAAAEPGAERYLEQMLAEIAREPAEELGRVPAEALAAAGITLEPSRPAAPVRPSPLAGWAADVWVQVARDFLASVLGGTSGMPLAAAVRSGADEPRTTLRCERLKSKAVYELVLDHAGQQTCHLTVQVKEHLFPGGLERLEFELRDADGRRLESRRAEDAAVRFRSLRPGHYTVVVLDGGAEADRLEIQLDASAEG